MEDSSPLHFDARLCLVGLFVSLVGTVTPRYAKVPCGCVDFFLFVSYYYAIKNGRVSIDDFFISSGQ
jgi:hypothetical protein